MKSHDDLVNEFMQKCKRDDPQRYEEVCSTYPTIDNRRWRMIRERERTAGLIGLQPSAIRPDIADRNQIESSYTGGDD